MLLSLRIMIDVGISKNFEREGNEFKYQDFRITKLHSSYEVSNKIFRVTSQFAKRRTNIKNEFSVANFPHVQINFQII